MNTNGDRLKAAAQAGDISLLYSVIQDNPSILDIIDLIPFVETPLHIAASVGHLQFATEIMMLKPSFAWKLNEQGFSPIHLAMQNNQKRMVSRFVEIDKDLVRVKGREGLTPLHFASQIGEAELLANFLFVCPESIEYLTSRRETALHIAVKNERYNALHVLVGWLKKNYKRDARKLEIKILDHKDEIGNTILHISALSSDPQALQLLVKTKINLMATNLENKTSLDIATTEENKSILISAGVKPSLEVTDAPTLARKLTSNMVGMDQVYINMRRIKSDISDAQRNTWLIVVTLVITATYQSALTPPGGVYQANASDNNVTTTSLNTTAIAYALTNAGTSVLTPPEFFIFSMGNMVSFFAASMSIFLLIDRKEDYIFFYGSIFSFVGCYLFCMSKISPTNSNSIVTEVVLYGVAFVTWIWWVIKLYNMLQFYVKKYWIIKTRNHRRGNI